MKRRFISLTAPIVALLLAGSAQAAETNAVPKADSLAGTRKLDDRQTLGAGDRVTYRVIEDQEEPKSLVVTDSGHLEVPYYGLVPAEGKTSRELAEDIEKRLEEELYYQATVVLAIEVADRTRVAGKVYVTGQVRNPGGYPIPAGENFTVSKAILSAGGFSDFSNKREVKLVRETEEGKQVEIVNVEDIWKNGEVEKDPRVRSDDLVVVPARLLNY